ncbi:hypothetical protein P389DRAFT_165011, partial [Cystobasidium minutum MCA 4210]|uniref:uncharacterized protein n=1 Tax=Cystobasidium minutum MCA 4210 TaxID=1397322 RepID=UPI0034CF5D25|eukprot:jgi/Rhomi1/165011/fgenesh1_kg.1_\
MDHSDLSPSAISQVFDQLLQATLPFEPAIAQDNPANKVHAQKSSAASHEEDNTLEQLYSPVVEEGSSAWHVTDDELPFLAYQSLRDIPCFALSSMSFVDDGYLEMGTEEALFEDIAQHWPSLSHRQRMQLIGSAEWAISHVRAILPKLASAGDI